MADDYPILVDNSLAGFALGAEFEVDRPCTLLGVEVIDQYAIPYLSGGVALWQVADTYGTFIKVSDENNSLSAPLVPGVTYAYTQTYQDLDDTYNIIQYRWPKFNEYFTHTNFSPTPPAPLKRFGPGRQAYLRGPSGSSYNPAKVIPYIYGQVTLSFSYSESILADVPPPLQISQSVAQFSLTLPELWRVPDMKEWEIQYAISSDNARWSDWIHLTTAGPQQITYAHTNVDPHKYYQYRYQVRQRALTSQWSGVADAGRPQPSIGATNSIGTNQLTPGAVDDVILGNYAVRPNHISNRLGDLFVFPDEAKAPKFRATSGGFYFPDGSVQTTAASGAATVRKYSVDLGAITGGTPVTITHGLGTKDVGVFVYNISTGEDVMVDVLRTAADPSNKIDLVFASNQAASTYRVVVFA